MTATLVLNGLTRKKGLSTKMFSSVNLNSEFSYFQKMGWGLRIKKYVYYGSSLKNLTFRVGSQKKLYRRDFLKRRAWTACRYKRGLGKKRGGVFEGD